MTYSDAGSVIVGLGGDSMTSLYTLQLHWST